MCLYQIPKYHLEFDEEKKPSSKISSSETSVWLIVRYWVEVKVSTESEVEENKEIRVRDEKKKWKWRRLVKPPMLVLQKSGTEILAVEKSMKEIVFFL